MRRHKRGWSDPPPRPKAAKLAQDQATPLLKSLDRSLQKSPVLANLGHQVRLARGRFYIECKVDDSETNEVLGRVTPLSEPAGTFLLESGSTDSGWRTIKKGKIRSITNSLANEGAETFYQLGKLDVSLKRAQKSSVEILNMERKDDSLFYYPDSSDECSVQEALYHYFHVPINIIAEPREWYAYKRSPRFMDISEDNKRLLVQFSATSMNGSAFGGVCLYIETDNLWRVYRIKPNQSSSIESAILWLEKRKWVSW